MGLITLEELKCSDLKGQLLLRGLSTVGKKNELKERLQQFLENEGKDPDTFEFEIKTPMELMTLMREESIAAQEVNRAAQEENRAAQRRIEELIIDDRLRLSEVENRVSNLEKLVKENVGEIETRLNNMVKQVQNGCHIQERIHSVEHAKTPAFDGTVSWSVYKAQFEIAARKNNWLTSQQKAENLVFSLRGEALQLLELIADRDDYDAIVKVLESRFGNQHAPEIFRAQLKSRRQKHEESLQQLEADIERLANLGYPLCPRNILNAIIADGFIAALKNSETQKALRVARVASPSEALAFAINYEASVEPSDRSRHVRKLGSEDEDELDDRVRRVIKERINWKGNNSPRCWSCGRPGHLQKDCIIQMFRPRQQEKMDHCRRNDVKQGKPIKAQSNKKKIRFCEGKR